MFQARDVVKRKGRDTNGAALHALPYSEDLSCAFVWKSEKDVALEHTNPLRPNLRLGGQAVQRLTLARDALRTE